MKDSDKWKQPVSPPPPLFFGKKERNLVKQVNDELAERVIGQPIIYYPISIDKTNFHDLYGEAINKSFLPPVRVYALVEWTEYDTVYTENIGVETMSTITIHFHKRRLTEDQDLFVRVGDFVAYGDIYYEIVKLSEPKRLFGQFDHRMEVSANCIVARDGYFNGT